MLEGPFRSQFRPIYGLATLVWVATSAPRLFRALSCACNTPIISGRAHVCAACQTRMYMWGVIASVHMLLRWEHANTLQVRGRGQRRVHVQT